MIKIIMGLPFGLILGAVITYAYFIYRSKRP